MIERTKAGIEEAKRKGIKLGRKPGLSDDAQKIADAASHMYKGGMKVLDICKSLRISRGTFYRYLKVTNTQLKLKD